MCTNNLSRLFKLVCDLSTDVIFNDLEGPQTQISIKVRPFFDAEYLQNGCTADTVIVTYYGRRIGNRTQAFNGI